jgi:hypothetical protein
MGMKQTKFTLAIPGLALVALMLSGCSGSEGQSSAAQKDGANSMATAPGKADGSGAVAADPIEVAYQNEIADCMRRQGFRYVPNPQSPDSGYDGNQPEYVGPQSLLKPDDVVRKWRQKYGFGAWSRIVYPNDPALRGPAEAPSPNEAVVKALEPAQREAYYLALYGSTTDSGGYDPKTMSGKAGDKLKKAADNSCQSKAAEHRETKMSTQKEPTRRHSAAENSAAQELEVKYRNDPAVAKASKKYADCFRERGYKMPLGNAVNFGLFIHGAGGITTTYAVVREDASTTQAKTELLAEIKEAVDDVDCRAPFAALIRSKYTKVIRNLAAGLPEDDPEPLSYPKSTQG